ncbi:WbqC family protein [Burkholderiaceae bacterium DAT-1]|nr:WbqC family protein [Burkholderiaceae bacterium DAT-1]
MRVAIMQPYFLPYIGYFQLIHAADVFVVYDNIKYTKSGWISRNRFLQNGSDAIFSLQLKKDSDSLDVVQRQISVDFDRNAFKRKLEGAYRKAPYFASVNALLDRILACESNNLFKFIHHSIREVCHYLNIDTPILISSEIPADHQLAGKHRVMSICHALNATEYLNPIGGVDLYQSEEFAAGGLALSFIKSKGTPYVQFDNSFVPWLSILDVMMFNSVERCMEIIQGDFDILKAGQAH